MGIKTILQNIKALNLAPNNQVATTWDQFDSFLRFEKGNAKEIKQGDYKSQLDQFHETVFNCISLNEKGVSSLPLRLFTTQESANKKKNPLYTYTETTKSQSQYLQQTLHPTVKSASQEYYEITEHPFLDLLFYVNKFQSSIHLISGTVDFLELTGNCFWYCPKNAAGRPAEIIMLPTQQFKEIKVNAETGDIISYDFMKGRDIVSYKPDEIIHFKYFNPYNQLIGLGRLVGANISVNRSNKMDVYEDATLDNMGRVDGVLSSDQALNEDAKKIMAEMWKQKYGGVYNAGKVAVLSNGTKYQQIALSMRDMSYPTGRKWTDKQICGAFGVPLSMVSGEHSSYTNAQTDMIFHGRFGLKPITMVIQETINEMLLPIYDKNIFCAFDDPVPEDKESELKETDILVKLGVMTINQAQIKHKLDPYPQDYIWTAQGLVPVSAIGMTPDIAGKALVDAVRKELGK